MNRIITCGVGVAGFVGFLHLKSPWMEKLIASSEETIVSSEPLVSVDGSYKDPLPSRSELITSLQDTDNEFDVLVIGGGATGAGVALDASMRGLKTALVEKNDYASGTSSKSTKLLHGGVRYLQKAIMSLDMEQYRLVKEALAERANVLASAPHICAPLAIVLPIYKWWQVPYFWVGIKLYDIVAGRKLIKTSYYVGKQEALELFPALKPEKLAGVIVYYDGQQDDARMNLSVILSAIRKGAKCVNRVEVLRLLFEEDDNGSKQVRGAHVRDTLTGKEWDVKSKSVINATGPFTDSIRKMNNADVKGICQPAAGVHVTLPDYYCARKYGLLDPATEDGRIIFFLPWEGKTIAGTTDRKCEVTFDPVPTKNEIDFIMKECKKYLNPDLQVRDVDILSAWSGIRPLVTDPSAKDTKSISRNHVIEVSESKLVSIAGGKWTTYRAMAEHTVDAVIKACHLSPTSGCCTEKFSVEGANGWTPTYYIRLIQEYGLEPEIAKHLSHSYGTKAPLVAKLAAKTGKRWPSVGKRLADDLPFIEADVLYAIKYEYACKVLDVISRRLRMAFLNVESCKEVVPKVIDIMAGELAWDEERKAMEAAEAKHCLESMDYKHIFGMEESAVEESDVTDNIIVDESHDILVEESTSTITTVQEEEEISPTTVSSQGIILDVSVTSNPIAEVTSSG